MSKFQKVPYVRYFYGYNMCGEYALKEYRMSGNCKYMHIYGMCGQNVQKEYRVSGIFMHKLCVVCMTNTVCPVFLWVEYVMSKFQKQPYVRYFNV